MNKCFTTCVFALITITLSAQNFTTQGNAIRHTVTASVNGEPVLYIGALDGSVSKIRILD